MVYDHINDVIARPAIVKTTDNLYICRFESMKVIAADFAVKTLLEKKKIDSNTILVDSSSGIYAYALALAAHKYGLQCHIIASTTVDSVLLFQLKTLGVEVEQVPPSTNLKYDQELRVSLVKKYLLSEPKAYWMRQYHDDIHYLGYEEVARQLVSADLQLFSQGVHIVWPVGSGASSCGLMRGFQKENVPVALSGIQPFGSISFGSAHIDDPDILVAGIGSAIPFENIDYTSYDYIHWVNADIAISGGISLLSDTGIFAGLSSGATYHVAQYLAQKCPGELFLAGTPDSGIRYQKIYSNHVTSNRVDAPRQITELSELAMPWSMMHWNRRSYTPIYKEGA